VGIGRWAYSNPAVVIPKRWPGANLDTVREFSRFMAIAFIFAGLANIGFALTGSLGGFAQWLLTLIIAPSVTWVMVRQASRTKGAQ
jgi:hypothetical protein